MTYYRFNTVCLTEYPLLNIIILSSLFYIKSFDVSQQKKVKSRNKTIKLKITRFKIIQNYMSNLYLSIFLVIVHF